MTSFSSWFINNGGGHTFAVHGLGSCCALILSGRENLLEKQLPSRGKGTMEPCSSMSRTLLCGQDKPFVGRAGPWLSQQDCHSAMLKYKEHRKNQPETMITLARSCKVTFLALLTSVVLSRLSSFFSLPAPDTSSHVSQVLGIPFLRPALLSKSLDMTHSNMGHDLQKDVLWEFPLKDSFISSRNKAGVLVIFPSISHPCTNHEPCLASRISQGWNILLSMANKQLQFFFPGETCYSKLHAGLQIAMISIYFFSQ